MVITLGVQWLRTQGDVTMAEDDYESGERGKQQLIYGNLGLNNTMMSLIFVEDYYQRGHVLATVTLWKAESKAEGLDVTRLSGSGSRFQKVFNLSNTLPPSREIEPSILTQIRD